LEGKNLRRGAGEREERGTVKRQKRAATPFLKTRVIEAVSREKKIVDEIMEESDKEGTHGRVGGDGKRGAGNRRAPLEEKGENGVSPAGTSVSSGGKV